MFAGTGAIVANDVYGGAVTHVGVALTFGLMVPAMIYAVGDVSGARLNPAVTLAFAAAGRFPVSAVGPYVRPPGLALVNPNTEDGRAGWTGGLWGPPPGTAVGIGIWRTAGD